MSYGVLHADSLLPFNSSPPRIMHIDINSCFATIEQQANPLLRGKPVAVAAYATKKGVILAASIEAKKLGIKTGHRVQDALKVCPKLIVKEPDADKYRSVHRALRDLFSQYTNDLHPKSIDEFVMDMTDYQMAHGLGSMEIGRVLKKRIRREVGDWISVSVGSGPSRFLAKTASNFQKPDGLISITKENVEDIYRLLQLVDLHGINVRNKARLNKVGIYSVMDFYKADLVWLKAAFASVSGYYWYTRLRGWEIDDIDFERKSFGNQYATNYDGPLEGIFPILQKLVEKTGTRMRRKGYKARGIHVSLRFQNGTYWHMGQKLPSVLFDSRDIYKEAVRLLEKCPHFLPLRVISESVFDLIKEDSMQLSFFDDLTKKRRIVDTLDAINEKWGDFSITPARTLPAYSKIPDRISFGGVREI